MNNYYKVKKAYIELKRELKRKEEESKNVEEIEKILRLYKNPSLEELIKMSGLFNNEPDLDEQEKDIDEAMSKLRKLRKTQKPLDRLLGINSTISSEQVYCHLNPETEPKEKYYSKPPLGVKPCFICAEERIKDLADGISRYAHKGDYEIIQKWAKEICLQCELAEMEKGNK